MPRRKSTQFGPPISGGKRGRKSRLSTVSFADLQSELRRRESVLQMLIQQRDRLSDQLRMLDEQIVASGGGSAAIMTSAPVGKRRRGRPVGSGTSKGMATPPHGRRGRGGGLSLAQSLQQVLAGTQMSVGQMTDAVKKNGYTTSSPNFRTMVNAALLANPTLFKRIQRGVYTIK